MELFSDHPIEVRRLALTMDQIDEYDPPAQPPKQGDKLTPAYVQDYGDRCWELDALEPSVLADLIDDAIREVTDDDAWAASEESEKSHRAVVQHWVDNHVDDLAIDDDEEGS